MARSGFRKLLLYPPELRGHHDLCGAGSILAPWADSVLSPSLLTAEAIGGQEEGTPEGQGELPVSYDLLDVVEGAGPGVRLGDHRAS